MIDNIQSINVDLTRKTQTPPPTVYVTQNDSKSRTVNINICNGGIASWDAEETPVKVNFEGIGGAVASYVDATMNDGGTITVVVPESACTVAGVVAAKVQILDDADANYLLSSMPFFVDISPNVVASIQGQNVAEIYEVQANKTNIINAQSTDEQYGSAKSVFDFVTENTGITEATIDYNDPTSVMISYKYNGNDYGINHNFLADGNCAEDGIYYVGINTETQLVVVSAAVTETMSTIARITISRLANSRYISDLVYMPLNVKNAIDRYIELYNAKADRVTSPTAGNLAGLDVNGNLTDSGINADYQLILVNGKVPYFEVTGTDVIVTVNSTLIYLNNKGTEKYVKSVATPITYVVSHNQMLIWNLDDNAVVVLGNNITRNKNNLVLFSNSTGLCLNGQFKQYFWDFYNKCGKPKANFTEKYEIVSNTCGSQGLTVVGDEIWHFNASADDHSGTGDILRFNKNFEQINTNLHNYGHCASADYNASTDTLLTGNGTWDTTIYPRIDLTPNAVSYTGGAWKSFVFGTDCISISFDTGTKHLGGTGSAYGTGAIACWGEADNIIYLATGQSSSPRKIFKVLLGMGTNNLSDSTGTDKTKWGTFLSDKTNLQYNGTAKILSEYTGTETLTYQGICYFDGHIYMSVGTTFVRLLKIKLLENTNIFSVVDSYELPNYAVDGSRVTYEPEGVCILDDMYFLMGMVNVNESHLVKIPIGGASKTYVDTQLATKQNLTKDLATETTLADTDTIPFYDLSVAANRKTTWANIKAKLSALFYTQTEIDDMNYSVWDGINNKLPNFEEVGTDDAISNDDQIMFYDTEYNNPQKTTWSNFKSLLQTVFTTVFESISNKITSISTVSNSATKYPSESAVIAYAQPKEPIATLVEKITVGYTQLTSGNFIEGTVYAQRLTQKGAWANMTVVTDYTVGQSISAWRAAHSNNQVASYSAASPSAISSTGLTYNGMFIKIKTKQAATVSTIQLQVKYTGSTTETCNILTGISNAGDFFSYAESLKSNGWWKTVAVGGNYSLSTGTMLTIPSSYKSISSDTSPNITEFTLTALTSVFAPNSIIDVYAF